MLRKRRNPAAEDRGASVIFVAFAMVLVLGIAAVAIDAGAGFVERRGDQSAVDVGTVAGAVEVAVGTSGGGVTEDSMVSSALDYVRANLPTTYTNAEWQALWQGCVDPSAERNSEAGDNFVALSPPTSWGWSPTDPPNWCVSIDAAKSLFRVRTPDQIIPSSFARVIGFQSLVTHAAAVAEIIPGPGNILPFGFPTGAGDGTQQCLSSGPSGLAQDPCDGPSAGNFGTLKVRRYTPSPYNGCNVAPTNSVLALNIAAGIDHTIVPDLDGNPANEIRDICYNFPVDTLQTDPGFPSGTENGLATGAGLPAGETARLQQGPQPKQNVVGYNLDDRPLWYWLLSGLDYDGSTGPASDDAPMFCDRDGFFTPNYDVDYDGVPDSQYDFDGDGVEDELASWQHMQRCLEDYAGEAAGTYTVVFSTDLGDQNGSDWSARFAYVPQFYEASLGPGTRWRHVLRYRAVFIEGTWWKRGPNWRIHFPGEPCAPCNGNNYAMWQVSAWIIPDAALPAALRGDPPGGGAGFINPFEVELVR